MSWYSGPLSLPRAAARSVQITLHNRPRNLAESRLILETLQKFGEVVTYRHLKHQPGIPQSQTSPSPTSKPNTTNANVTNTDEKNHNDYKDAATKPNPKNTVVAIFDTPDAASRAVAASPVKIALAEKMITANPPTADQYRHRPDPWAFYEAKAKAKRLKYMKIYIEPWAVAPVPAPVGRRDVDSGEVRVVTSRVELAATREENEFGDGSSVRQARNNHDDSYAFDHERDMLQNPYHGPFFIDQDTYQFQDLWRNSRIPLRELADGMIARKEHLPRQSRMRVERENDKLGAASLMEMYREGVEKERMEGERERGKQEEQQEQEEQGQKMNGEMHEHDDDLDLHDNNGRRDIDRQYPTNHPGKGRES